MSEKVVQGNYKAEKIKVTSAEIVVHGTEDKPYYEIKYYDIADGEWHVGYSSYYLDFVFKWLKECFEIVGESEGDSMSEIKLLPCPFCGGEAQLVRDRIGLWRVGCKKCDCTTTYQFGFGEGEEVSQKKAANVWNTRKPMERIVEQLEEMGNIKFSSFSKPLIAVEDVLKIVKGGAE